jgi:dTDP-4-dehydrorhamnose reductase
MSGKILVIGRIGQVGYELHRGAWPSGFTVDYVERQQVDLARASEARDIVVSRRPDIVVNAAAYTAVDAAETDRETAFAVNRDGPAALAEACASIGAALIHYSTDYVFDGTKSGAYIEDDVIHPLSVYGASKAEGDAAIRARLDRHVIIRTSWVYSPIGHNFVKTMLRLGAERDKLGIVDDQIGSPTAAFDIAAATIAICRALAQDRENGFGVFNFSGDGVTSWYGFARAIFAGAAARGLQTPHTVEPIATKAYPTPAPRPRNSVLDCGKIARTYGIAARPWQEALAACLDEIVGARPQPAVTEGALR